MNQHETLVSSTDPNRNVTQRQRRAALFTNDLREEIPECPEEEDGHDADPGDNRWEDVSIRSAKFKSFSSGSEPNDC